MSDNLPETKLISIDGNELALRPDLRHHQKVEDSYDRLARAGLSVQLFPHISFHSSGLTFCSIGNVNPMLTEFITKLAKFGSRWEFEVQLGVGTGMGKNPSLPSDYDQEMIEMVKTKNIYTVEGLLTARQDLMKSQYRLEKIARTAQKVFQNSKTELIKSSIKMHGLRPVFRVLSIEYFDENYHTKVLNCCRISFMKTKKGIYGMWSSILTRAGMPILDLLKRAIFWITRKVL